MTLKLLVLVHADDWVDWSAAYVLITDELWERIKSARETLRTVKGGASLAIDDWNAVPFALWALEEHSAEEFLPENVCEAGEPFRLPDDFELPPELVNEPQAISELVVLSDFVHWRLWPHREGGPFETSLIPFNYLCKEFGELADAVV